MDYFSMGFYSLFFCIQMIIFSIIVYKSYFHLRYIRRVLRDESVFQKRYFLQHLDESTSDLFDKMEDLKYDMMEIQKCVLANLNDKVNWTDLKQKHPVPLELVLLKLKDSQVPYKGCLNQEKNGWTLLSPFQGKSILKMGEVTFWKPIINI